MTRKQPNPPPTGPKPKPPAWPPPPGVSVEVMGKGELRKRLMVLEYYAGITSDNSKTFSERIEHLEAIVANGRKVESVSEYEKRILEERIERALA